MKLPLLCDQCKREFMCDEERSEAHRLICEDCEELFNLEM
jgi:uncharacterized protein YbaR (Trm112 family)